ncbi:MAG TPA: GNAT family N-acetyltransferase [Hanamia sp.]|nr:GNAT family N-acetyltransferase [Hanamia sp.]
MIKATNQDKERVIDILAQSFDDNQSVNYIIKQDKKRNQRIRKLMAYSFDICYLYGEVFLTDDRSGCALILFPDQKKNNLKSILLDIKLIGSCIGTSNIKKAMKRESKIKKLQPKKLMYYLWFIGVEPDQQNSGIGSALMKEIIEEAHSRQWPIYLETSTLKNIPWYEKFGFKIYNELNLGYPLFFMMKE